MRTLQEIMDSLEQSVYLRAREKESNQIRDEFIKTQEVKRQATLSRAFTEFDQIDESYQKQNRAPQ